MFREHLQRIVEQTEGAVAGLLMGFDGIAVDSFSRVPERLDIQTVGMEFSFILTQVRKAAEILEVGGVKEVVIRAEQVTIVIMVLTQEYFIALALTPEGNAGKGRYLLRVTAPKLQAEL